MSKTKPNATFIKPFRMGAVVHYTAKAAKRDRRDRDEHIIKSVDTGRLEINKYSTP